VTALPVAPQAIRAETQPEYQPAPTLATPEPRGPYASWDDFRANSPALQRTLLDLATRVLPDMRNMPRERLPADLPPAADALGVPVASVMLTRAGTSAGRLLMLGMAVAILGGLLLAIALVERHWSSRLGLGLFVAFTASMLALRFGLLRLAALQSVQLWLFEHGVLWHDGTAIGVRRFEDIEDFRAMRDGNEPRILLVPRQGVRLMLTLRSTVAILPLAEYLELRMASAQLVPKLERIVGGERVRFGAVTLDRRGFAGPAVAAPWSEIVRVMGDRRQIFVDRRDQPGWQSIRAGDVSCPMLMLVIAHILVEEAARLPARGVGLK
jgi:hypothetical protein